jgi:hypothetical protein
MASEIPTTVPEPTQEFVKAVVDAIVNPLLGLIFLAGFAYFLWGLTTFIISLSTGDESKLKEGKQHMLWGIVGLVVMVSVYALIAMILATFGVEGSDLPDPLPF